MMTAAANTNMEKLVLGSVILNPDSYWDVESMLSGDVFMNSANQVVYSAIRDLASVGKKIDKDLIASRVIGDLDGADPVAYISALIYMASREHSLPIVDYAEALRDQAIRRRLAKLCDEIKAAAIDQKYQISSVVERAATRIADLAQSSDADQETTLSQAVRNIAKKAGEDKGERVAIDFCLNGMKDLAGNVPFGSLVLIGGGPGSGKRLCINTPIPTPAGFTTMGDLKVGDRVFSLDGTVTEVTGVSPILMANRSFKVVFNTGEEILADGDHLWKTMTRAERRQALRRTREHRAARRAVRPSRAVSESKAPWVSESLKRRNSERAYDYLPVPTGTVRNTDEIRETLMIGEHVNHSVDVCGPLDLPAADLKIDPYLLGLWLGDGSSSKGVIGMSSSDWDEILPTIDRSVQSSREELAGTHGRQADYKDVSFAGLYLHLKAEGLIGRKHIPMKYLRASAEQRLALLQGLMDTDGTCDHRSGSVTLCLSDERLIRDAHQLVSSLGIKATIRTRPTDHKDRHDVKFTTSLPVFRLKRKLDRQKLAQLRPTVKRRYIVAVEPVEPRLMRCISVAHPDRTYLVGNSFIATHNTAFAMQQAIHTSRTHATSVFELEMDGETLVARSLRDQTGLSVRQIMGGIDQQQQTRLRGVADAVQGHRLRLAAQGNMTIEGIRSRAMSHKSKYGLDLLVIDHIKLIKRNSKHRIDPVEAAYQSAYDLKSLAKEVQCVVMLLCQFTKAGRAKETAEPEMDDFYGGALEEHGDLMIALLNRYDWLERNPPRTRKGQAYEDWLASRQKSKGKLEVYKLKDRLGVARGHHVFEWDGARSRFSDVTAAQGSFLATSDELEQF